MARKRIFYSCCASLVAMLCVSTSTYSTAPEKKVDATIVSSFDQLDRQVVVLKDHSICYVVAINRSADVLVGTLPNVQYALGKIDKYPKPKNDPKPDNTKVKESQRWQSAYHNTIQNRC